MSPKLCHLYARTDALFDRHCYFESMDRDSERVTYLSDEVGRLRERICNVMALLTFFATISYHSMPIHEFEFHKTKSDKHEFKGGHQKYNRLDNIYF